MRVSSHLGMVICLMGMLIMGCAKPKVTSTSPVIVPVTVAVASAKTVPVQVKGIGNVKAIATVSVRAQFGGQLMEVHFKEGDFVEKGKKLFTIDPRMYQAAVKLATANLAKSKAVLKGAERILERVERLGGGAVSLEDIDVARTAVDSARAVVAADEAALNTAQVQETYTIIKSPIDGRTGGLLVTAGNLVSASDASPLVVVNQVSPIHVAFTIPEQQLLDVTSANRDKPLKVQAYLRNGEKPVEGVLAFIDNAVDSATGTVQLKAEFKNADLKLWPGQFVDVVMTIKDRPESVMVPTSAIQSGQQGQYVYVVTPKKSVEMRVVTVAFEIGGEAVVASGLKSGETVVMEGQLRLAPGSLIEVKGAATQPVTTATAPATGGKKE